jgi:hypothetical protein
VVVQVVRRLWGDVDGDGLGARGRHGGGMYGLPRWQAGPVVVWQGWNGDEFGQRRLEW